MHELSLLSDLMRKITSVAQEQHTEKVVSIRVKLGALCHLSPHHFREHFTHAARGTVAEEAQLEIEVMTDETDPNAQEIVLESVEIEV
jgi:hydrogenase nickel incorporation protein HypA/HybF